MIERCYSDSGSEHQVTLMVVLKYHGEKIVDVNGLELEVLESLSDTFETGAVDGADYYIMEASVDTISDIQTRWNFDECDSCASQGTSDCVTEYCVIRGPVRD